ncbi:MAG: NAD(P)H-hydrate dehydratase [Ignavibacteriales bacterium]|nr:NAD(P)H-hydrate dehydratase [Ignavibacteriales bacterium]
MRTVLSADEMRRCDDYTIKKLGVPGLVLMENAGSAVAKIVRKRLGTAAGKTVAVVCGKGNNGGDGFVVARKLADWGFKTIVLSVGSTIELKGDAKTNFDILRKLRNSAPALSILRFSKVSTKDLHPDLVVDAIFGTGFSGKPREPFLKAISWINCQHAPVVSVDIPSGVNGTTGVAEGEAVHASETVTFAFEKTGLLCNQGIDLRGKISVAEIGIPVSAANEIKSSTFTVEPGDIQRLLPRRPTTSYKYSVGKIFVLAGSKGLTGAAVMCSTAALRSGAGAVILGAPEAVYSVLARRLTEVMVTPLPSTSEGSVAAEAFAKVGEKLDWADVVIVGPGLSQNPETQAFVKRVIQSYSGKILLDADGLNAASNFGLKVLKSQRAEMILTPHTGEFARLFKTTSRETEDNRVEVSRTAARALGQTVVLKGAPTATASSKGIVYLNSTGNPGMATAGAGDVLSGIIAGLWAQGMEATEAAYCGVYLHGLSGDMAKKKFGERSLLAMDLLDFLPEAFLSLEGRGNC